MNRILTLLSMILFLSFRISAQTEVPRKMEIGTNFWNINWHDKSYVFRPDIVWKDALSYESIWNSQFLNELQIYSSLRFMDWGETNSSSLRHWEDRTLPTEAPGRVNGEKRGVAYEWWIDLCNRVEADIWVCIPHAADDNFIREFAKLVRDSLDPDLDCYLELSNEVWNFRVQQDYCAEKGVEIGLGDKANSDVAMLYQAYRSTEMWKIWMEEWGGQEERIIKVISGHSANSGRMRKHFEFFESSSNYLELFPDAYGIAPYFGNNVNGNDPNVYQVLEDYIINQKPNGQGGVIKDVQTHYSFLQERGVDLVCYEGGQHITDNAVAPNRNPKMYELYTIYLDTLQYYIPHFSHYVHLGTFGSGGCWGSLEYTGQSLEDAHKYRALVNYVHRNSPPVFEKPDEINLVTSNDKREFYITGIDDNNPRLEQQISITASSKDPEILGDPEITYDGGDTAVIRFVILQEVVDTVDISLSLSDDGGTEDGGEDSHDYYMQVKIYEQWNHKPEVDPVEAIQMFEDQNRELLLTGLDDGDPEEQELFFEVENISSNIDEFLVDYNGGSTATITLIPREEKFGEGSFRIRIRDNGGADNNNGDQLTEMEIEASILPVNDPPGILEITDTVNIHSEKGPQQILIRGVNDGDSKTQHVTVAASTKDNSLIEKLELKESTSDNKRELEVTPVAGASGLAKIEILVKDDGGTANGGTDEFRTSIIVNIDVFTSITHKDAGEFSIYPNPATEYIEISIPDTERYEINVINPGGQRITNIEVNKLSREKIRINVSNLKPGLYFLRLEGESTISQERFIVL